MTSHLNAEVRGQLRLWKEQLTRHYAAVDRLFGSAVIGDAAHQMMAKKGDTGRRRAFDRSGAAAQQCGAVLEAVSLTGSDPIAVWAVLKPRDAVTVSATNPSDRLRQLHRCRRGAPSPQSRTHRRGPVDPGTYRPRQRTTDGALAEN
jgi:hypothetical protein